MSKNIAITGILNDFHSGSNVSLLHPHAYNLNGGRKVDMNKYQKGLWEFWENKIVPRWKDLDCLVLNGDLCELMMPRQAITECWSRDPIDQINNVYELVKMLSPKKIYIIKGTPYHVVDNGTHVEEQLGSTFADRGMNVVQYQHKYAYEYRMINLAPKDGKPRVFHVTHHMGSTGVWQYRGTAPSKSMATLMLNESHFIDRKVWKRISGIIRAHVHHYWYEESANRVMLVNPCWQLATPFMLKVMPESVPDIGGTQLEIHKDGTIAHERFLMDSNVMMPPVFKAFD